MQPKLEGFAAAVLAELDADGRAVVAGDMETLRATVEANGELRAALTDTSLSGAVRASVLVDLIDTQLGAGTVRLASYGVRVVPATDTPSAIADLAHHAHARTHVEDYTSPSLGHSAARQRVAGFADGVLETLDVADFDQIEDDLFRWARTIEGHTELRRLLVDRDASADARTNAVRRLLESRVAAPTLRLALYVVEGGRARDVVGTLDYLVDYVARARDWRIARVWTARAIPAGDRATLEDALRAVSGTPVDLQVVEEPDLLGGVLLQIGDLRLDATTRGRLDALHETLTAAAATAPSHLGEGPPR